MEDVVAGLRHVWKESQPACSAQGAKPTCPAHLFLAEMHNWTDPYLLHGIMAMH